MYEGGLAATDGRRSGCRLITARHFVVEHHQTSAIPHQFSSTRTYVTELEHDREPFSKWISPIKCTTKSKTYICCQLCRVFYIHHEYVCVKNRNYRWLCVHHEDHSVPLFTCGRPILVGCVSVELTLSYFGPIQRVRKVLSCLIT